MDAISTTLPLHTLEHLPLDQTGTTLTKLRVLHAVLPKVKRMVLKTTTKDETVVTGLLTSAVLQFRQKRHRNIYALWFVSPQLHLCIRLRRRYIIVVSPHGKIYRACTDDIALLAGIRS